MPSGRQIYKEIAPHLIQATLLELGKVYEDRINDLFDNLLGAQHQWRHRAQAGDAS
jgi:hypothetical protein